MHRLASNAPLKANDTEAPCSVLILAEPLKKLFSLLVY